MVAQQMWRARLDGPRWRVQIRRRSGGQGEAARDFEGRQRLLGETARRDTLGSVEKGWGLDSWPDAGRFGALDTLSA